ncbi:hypothetical protein GKD08_04765 [Paeniclostridium sordellii]|uniref:hypothetical protein n=1 Tax=Paraclostridium sordellii TaxID=1505 RepID=UPI0005E8B6F5|nr:hypothetical protein [Paeniclostridium sordellii]MRZ28074.1 hypothetical protein [Paeniclostridium sordellii]CEP50250.1 Uncharacterised protein [[Clostridium] sordellii] [Paeniclostridium sordellii]
MKKVIEELEQSKVQILKLISKKPKDNDAKKLLEVVEKTIGWLEKENKKFEKNIEAYGSIEVQIENYSFIRDERIDKGISVYKVDLDGLYEYIDLIKVCKKHLNSINNIEGLKELAIEWYMENIQNEKVVLKNEN